MLLYTSNISGAHPPWQKVRTRRAQLSGRKCLKGKESATLQSSSLAVLGYQLYGHRLDVRAIWLWRCPVLVSSTKECATVTENNDSQVIKVKFCCCFEDVFMLSETFQLCSLCPACLFRIEALWAGNVRNGSPQRRASLMSSINSNNKRTAANKFLLSCMGWTCWKRFYFT